MRAETCLALGSCLGIGGLGQVLVFSRVVLPDAKASFEGVSNLSITFLVLSCHDTVPFCPPACDDEPRGENFDPVGTKPVYVKSNGGQGKFDTTFCKPRRRKRCRSRCSTRHQRLLLQSLFVALDAPPSAGSELGRMCFISGARARPFTRTPLFKAAAILESGI